MTVGELGRKLKKLPEWVPVFIPFSDLLEPCHETKDVVAVETKEHGKCVVISYDE